MARSVWPKVALGAALLSLAGCGWLERAERPAWRAQAENYCLARDLVKPSAYIEPQPEIDGPGICGLTHPFKVSALAEGTVAVDKNVTIGCPLVVALEGWLAEVVQPYAQADFGENVVELEAFGAYSCRSVDNIVRRAAVRAFVRQRDRRLRLPSRRRPRDLDRARLEEDRHPGGGVPARGPRRRLPALHHRARAGGRRLPLQPFPSRPGDARLDLDRPAPLLPAEPAARPAAAARPARRPAAGARSRRADGRRPRQPAAERRPARPARPVGGVAAAARLRGRPAPPPVLPPTTASTSAPTSAIPLSKDD